MKEFGHFVGVFIEVIPVEHEDGLENRRSRVQWGETGKSYLVVHLG